MLQICILSESTFPLPLKMVTVDSDPTNKVSPDVSISLKNEGQESEIIDILGNGLVEKRVSADLLLTPAYLLNDFDKYLDSII